MVTTPEPAEPTEPALKAETIPLPQKNPPSPSEDTPEPAINASGEQVYRAAILANLMAKTNYNDYSKDFSKAAQLAAEVIYKNNVFPDGIRTTMLTTDCFKDCWPSINKFYEKYDFTFFIGPSDPLSADQLTRIFNDKFLFINPFFEDNHNLFKIETLSKSAKNNPDFSIYNNQELRSRFATAYKERFENNPSAAAYEGYDAACLLYDLIGSHGYDVQKVKTYLRQMYDGS
jgi:hypothetical protein